jgi:hypothetical protein
LKPEAFVILGPRLGDFEEGSRTSRIENSSRTSEPTSDGRSNSPILSIETTSVMAAFRFKKRNAIPRTNCRRSQGFWAEF